MHVSTECSEIHDNSAQGLGAIFWSGVRRDVNNAIKKKKTQVEHYGRVRSLRRLLQRHELPLLYLWRSLLFCKLSIIKGTGSAESASKGAIQTSRSHGKHLFSVKD